MASRPLLVRVVVLAALMVAGVLVTLAADGATAGTAVGLALFGLAGILLVGLAFYEVGRSEDRDRARRDRPPGP